MAMEPAVQAQALRMLGRSISGNSAGTAGWGFHAAPPYFGSGNWVGPIFTEGHMSEISADPINREVPLALSNLATGYYPTTNFVYAHPNNIPPSGLSDSDLNLGRLVIAVDSAGNMFCSAGR